MQVELLRSSSLQNDIINLKYLHLIDNAPLMPSSRSKSSNPLNILLTNGRFPVSLALARQLKLAGHRVYVVGEGQMLRSQVPITQHVMRTA